MSLTPDESAELQRLLAKAKGRAVPPRAVLDDEDFAEYDPATGLFFNPISGDVENVWDVEDMSAIAGAMTDGSKRRDDGMLHPPAKKSVAAKSQAAPYGMSSRDEASLPYVSTNSGLGVPFPGADDAQIAGKIELPEMPADISDVTMWGQTLIAFGNYKSSNMSYFDLVNSEDPRAVSYVKWCRSRTKTAQGQLRDLCNYMMHFFEDDMGTGHQIPGTTQTRRFKQ
eukprot:s343_g4.t1